MEPFKQAGLNSCVFYLCIRGMQEVETHRSSGNTAYEAPFKSRYSMVLIFNSFASSGKLYRTNTMPFLSVSVNIINPEI
jgi:hypothetical protein